VIPNLATLQLLQPFTARVILEAPVPGARGYADCRVVSGALEKMGAGITLSVLERNAVVACLLWARDVFACPLERAFTGLGAVDVDGRVACQLGSRTFRDGDTTLRAGAAPASVGTDNIVADFAVVSGDERRRAFDRCGLALRALGCVPCQQEAMPSQAIVAVEPGHGPDRDLSAVAVVVSTERERAARYSDGARTGVLPPLATRPGGLPTPAELVLAAEDRWNESAARDVALGGALGVGLVALGGVSVYFGAKALKGE
jgi:hypothetical protein